MPSTRSIQTVTLSGIPLLSLIYIGMFLCPQELLSSTRAEPVSELLTNDQPSTSAQDLSLDASAMEIPVWTLASPSMSQVASSADAKPAAESSGASSGGDLAKAAQNPIASLISIPIQNTTSFNVGPLNRTQNSFNLQPVIPIALNENWNLITRTIIPIIYQAAPPEGGGGILGFGDINASFFFSPKSDSNVTWGVGPIFVIPSATDQFLGTGKYSVGPTAVIVWIPGKFVVGNLILNYWSFAGENLELDPFLFPFAGGATNDVSQFLNQIFINYNLGEGWYLTTQPPITANWTADPGEQWVVPVGGGFGRIFSIGEQRINANLQAYANVIKPEGAPSWYLQTTWAFLFPRSQ